jgi:hypothetical protein
MKIKYESINFFFKVGLAIFLNKIMLKANSMISNLVQIL